ncbi:MAG: response regulator [Methylocystaceae bacterium]|nr:response regulator [Methylocystaceae bacterium]
MNNKQSILVVDDDMTSRVTLAGYFEKEGYSVYEAEDGIKMWEILGTTSIDLIMLDIRLPGDDGLTLLRDIRKNSDIGIIMVTGKSDDIDRIVALEMGADDYVTKPFNARELLARSKNLIRRVLNCAAQTDDSNIKHFSGWTLYQDQRRLMSPDGEDVRLTRGEFELLNAFAGKVGRVLTRDNLLDVISHREWDPTDRTIDVLIGRIRRKIEPDPQNPVIILTVHGVGYVFSPRN